MEPPSGIAAAVRALSAEEAEDAYVGIIQSTAYVPDALRSRWASWTAHYGSHAATQRAVAAYLHSRLVRGEVNE